MSNVNRWYASRETVKAAVGIVGAKMNALIDSYIESASERIENVLDRRFIPETATKYYRWPQTRGRALTLELDADLLSVTTLQSQAQDSSPTTIASTDYFLEPVNSPPYRRIEIDLSSSASFQSGDTPQRSISVLGSWGYEAATQAAGNVTSGLASSASATSMVCSDGSLINVGDTLLIESEQIFVSERATVALAAGANPTADIDALVTAQSIEVSDSTLYKANEVILIDSERMLVTDLPDSSHINVIRAWDGTTLAAHTLGSTVYAYRTLTIVRGVNGTTAATHANNTTVRKYRPPADITEYCRARAILSHKQASAGYTGELGGGEGSRNVEERALAEMERCLIERYGLVTI